jgi:hypothetical protein
MLLYNIMPLQKSKKKKKTAYKKTGSVTQIVNVNVGSSGAKKKRKKRSTGTGVNPMGGLRGQATTFAQAAPPPQIIYSPQATTESIRGLLSAPNEAPLTKQLLEQAGSRFQQPALSRQSSYTGSMYSIDTSIGDAGQKLLRSTSAHSVLHQKKGLDVREKPIPLDNPVPAGTSPATSELHPKETIRIRLSKEQKAQVKAQQEAIARRNLGKGGASIMEPIGEGM